MGLDETGDQKTQYGCLPHKRLITCSDSWDLLFRRYQDAGEKRRCVTATTSAVWTPGGNHPCGGSWAMPGVLRGGTSSMTPLKGVDSQVYALAQADSGWRCRASAGGSSVQANQLNGGRITNGAVIERELPSQFGALGYP
ncbi:flagellar basal body P-ring protein FlgI [Shigella sonnei]